MMHSLTKSRYPGIRAFEKNERHVFFGRRMESKKLFSLVKAKPLVVLFAKSGIGKSSLINAGLEPLLEKDYFQIIKIRLQTTAVSSVEMVKNELTPFLNEAKLKAHSKGNPGLWEYLRACEFKKGEEDLTPVLVFDQFEEFFEHNKEDQKELNEELADMVSDRLPERIRESLRAIPFRDRSKEELDWHSPIPVKFVFAIRSDRVSLMDEMSTKIPSILHNRFHLKPLGIDAAKEAIEEPASLIETSFDSLPFTYDPPALNTILAYLKNKNDEIESFQLQLLCRNIERTVQRKNTEDAVVKESDFGGKAGIKSILNNYYEQEMAELEAAEQPLARKFIEEGLIVAGRRVGVNEGVEAQMYGIKKDLLSKLLASRILRAENTHLGRSYELSHDTLVAPILESYEIRRRKEEKEAIQEREREQEQMLAVERKKSRRAIYLAAAGFLLFAIAAVAGVIALQQSAIAKAAQEEAEKAKEIAIKQRDKADEARRKVETTQLKMAEINLRSGKSNLELDEYEAASENFKMVLALESAIDTTLVNNKEDLFEEARTLLDKAENSGNIRETYDDYMRTGDRAFDNEKYKEAYAKFRAAQRLNVSTNANRKADLQIDATANKLVRLIGKELDKADKFYKAKNCRLTKDKIKEIEAIKRIIKYKFSALDQRKLERLKSACQ